MLRVALAGLLALHGFAHLVGFAVPWRILQTEEMPYSTTLLAGRVDVGDMGIRAVGLVWLGLAMAFGVAALGAWMQRPGWPDVAMTVAGLSLVFSVLGLPASRIGIPVNLLILAVLLGGAWAGRW